jgi:hypothetical protein
MIRFYPRNPSESGKPINGDHSANSKKNTDRPEPWTFGDIDHPGGFRGQSVFLPDSRRTRSVWHIQGKKCKILDSEKADHKEIIPWRLCSQFLFG